ncbi:hypothetical protein COCOR_00658 [Corallococcus coralloides DSM 2259]|uniref:Rhomboid family intramembrane serine protease n=1 Tax=Corallococcus coralloides (strain ATCC 25202 / DSM 2259 / NBRC 100086 / M2) TaxID=1144275 RepID=H8MG33_CORCM|nr:hypothetical protein [Corallococcus coralloides]AFE03624.1 hypothetical protein COCOR_00658 [Corallococcus coralloides DSM 2259]
MVLAPFVLAVLVAAQAPPVTSSGTVSAPPLVASEEACAADSDYAAGFDALVRGQDAQALELLERVMLVCPGHPYAPELARLARTRLEPGARLARDTLARPVVAESETSVEGPSKGARASLTVVQTLHGITQGILLCEISNCQDGRAYVAVSLLGGGAGAAISLLATRSGLTQGQAAAINSGTVWGFGYGLASIGSFDLDGDSSTGAVMAGALGFTGLGILVAEFARPTAGQVSLANSGGLWAGVVTGLLLATQSNGDTRAFFGIEQGVVGAGLITFALVSRHLDISRGRVLLIDAGGILGGLVGLSALFLALDSDHGDALLVGTAAGVLAGLGTATFLTRDFDAPDDVPTVSVVPATLGRHGGLGLAVLGQF